MGKAFAGLRGRTQCGVPEGVGPLFQDGFPSGQVVVGRFFSCEEDIVGVGMDDSGPSIQAHHDVLDDFFRCSRCVRVSVGLRFTVDGGFDDERDVLARHALLRVRVDVQCIFYSDLEIGLKQSESYRCWICLRCDRFEAGEEPLLNDDGEGIQPPDEDASSVPRR